MCARPAARSRGAAARGWSPPARHREARLLWPRPLPAHHGPGSQPASRGVASPRGTGGRGCYTCERWAWPGAPPPLGVGVASAIEEFSARMSAAVFPPPAPLRLQPSRGALAPRLALLRGSGTLGQVQVRFAHTPLTPAVSCRLSGLLPGQFRERTEEFHEAAGTALLGEERAGF